MTIEVMPLFKTSGTLAGSIKSEGLRVKSAQQSLQRSGDTYKGSHVFRHWRFIIFWWTVISLALFLPEADAALVARRPVQPQGRLTRSTNNASGLGRQQQSLRYKKLRIPAIEALMKRAKQKKSSDDVQGANFILKSLADGDPARRKVGLGKARQLLFSEANSQGGIDSILLQLLAKEDNAANPLLSSMRVVEQLSDGHAKVVPHVDTGGTKYMLHVYEPSLPSPSKSVDPIATWPIVVFDTKEGPIAQILFHSLKQTSGEDGMKWEPQQEVLDRNMPLFEASLTIGELMHPLPKIEAGRRGITMRDLSGGKLGPRPNQLQITINRSDEGSVGSVSSVVPEETTQSLEIVVHKPEDPPSKLPSQNKPSGSSVSDLVRQAIDRLRRRQPSGSPVVELPVRR